MKFKIITFAYYLNFDFYPEMYNIIIIIFQFYEPFKYYF